MRSFLVPEVLRASYFNGNEEKFAIVKMCLTHSSVEETLHIVIGVMQSVVIFMLTWFGQNHHPYDNDHRQSNLINGRHVD